MRFKEDLKFGMLQVRENEISLRKWSDGTAHLRTVEGTLIAVHFLESQPNACTVRTKLG